MHMKVGLVYRGGHLMGVDENKALSNRVWEEIWHQGNLSRIDELFAPDAVSHDPGMDVQGTEAIKQFVASMRAAFPDLHYTVEDQIADGDKVVVRYIGRGTHQGALLGIPPTEKQISYTGIAIQRFADGKIAEQWAEADGLGLMRQLGAIPAPGQVSG